MSFFDTIGDYIDSGTDFATGAADTAADGGSLEDVPAWEEPVPVEDLGGGYEEGVFVASDDGSLSDYGGSLASGVYEPSLDEQAEAVWSETTIGDEIGAGPAGSSSYFSDLGWDHGYADGYNGKPSGTSSKPPILPYLRDAYVQGYAEGYLEGTQDRALGKPAPGGSVVKPPPGPGPTPDPNVAPGMSTGMKFGLAALGAAVVVGGIVIARKQRRKAA